MKKKTTQLHKISEKAKFHFRNNFVLIPPVYCTYGKPLALQNTHEDQIKMTYAHSPSPSLSTHGGLRLELVLEGALWPL